MIANFASMDIKPGSMGKPLPGVTAAIVERRHDGEVEVVKAFVALWAGHEPGDALRRELMAHARRRLGPAVAPREGRC